MPKSSRRKPQPQGDGTESDQYDDEISLFHKDREKILLDSDQAPSDDTEEEEVYPLVDDDDDSDDDEEIAGYQQQLRQLKRNKFKKKLDSDLEEEAEDDTTVPDSRAWGSKKSWFMGGDVRDNKIILSGSEDEAGAAAMEEKEALEIQKRHAAFMSEEDFMIPTTTKTKKPEKKKTKKKDKGEKKSTEETDDEENEIHGLVKSGKAESEKVQADFSNLSRKEELEIMKRLHPEYIPLVSSFNAKCIELRDRILPLMGLVRQGQIQGLGKDYVLMKYHIIINYLSNGITYMKMVAKRASGIHEHPVIKRIVQFDNLYKRLVPVDMRVKEDLDNILERRKQGEDVGMVLTEAPGLKDNKQKKGKNKGQKNEDSERRKKKHKAELDDGAPKKKRKIAGREEAEDEESEDDGEEKGIQAAGVNGDADADADEEERRAITYQMEKNKGLTVHKKKEARNPRVKHRTKFRRAQIRRKGQVRDYKSKGHPTIYSGETTGIRAGIIRSRKLK